MTGLRYFRRTPLSRENSELFENEVEWLRPFRENTFYQIDKTFPLNSHELHKNGEIVGMDAASAAPVWALRLEEGLTCLDLCCAPGMKLSLISELVGSDNVVGTDVSEPRLDVCYNLLGKLGYVEVRKYLNQRVNENECVAFDEVRQKRKRNGGKKRRNFEAKNPFEVFYDRVLVDTECSHDGSVRHTVKHESGKKEESAAVNQGFWSKHSYKTEKNRVRYSTEAEMEGLIYLQKQLIRKGFSLLKSGGIMVYSTCSLQPRQNQEIVEDFLKEIGEEAKCVELPFACVGDQTTGSLPSVPAKRISENSCLFDPTESGTSGQFLAVISRR